ncbi:hypothetical protein Fcan01_04638 [Folsomia candida]|uniref:Uncharacterized protein n=1 Tax=Folsomia candida TaxID=158441 RepID=A0A226ET97_FOLCA|nr:hypothetical protein Fcan01_04638 [Folsomia candida]
MKMRKKTSNRNSMMENAALFFVIVLISASVESLSTQTTPATPAVVTTPNLETCQCGVFLLGTQPLVFSADAKPILSGMPVPANCSARDDKLQCASICRQLIETMSQSNEDSPLVQTVVLAATRTLACQRFNESDRVPLPRTIDASQSHVAKLDGSTNQWKFMVGPAARSDINNEAEDDEEEDNTIGRLTQPKYLGGFYRFCDEHWIYAGVSLHEPLCCLQHLPKKCPPSKSQARNGRRPRLIIRRCKNDDCSSEEDGDFQTLDLITEKPSSTTTTKAPPTTQAVPNSDEETEFPDHHEQSDDANATSSEMDTINPFDDTNNPPVKNRKPLNSTAVAEAFKFLTSLMDSIGYGDVVQGITSVLPASTAAELIDRVDVGGWVSNYQDRYMTWPREFSMGYCYLEYSLFNMANEGFSATANNLMNRLFKNQRSGSSSGGPSNMNLLNTLGLPPHHQPLGELLPGGSSGTPIYSNNVNNVNNYISPMAPQLQDNGVPYGAYGHPGMPGNRRVRRGVTVSRSYSGVGETTGSDPSRPTGIRRIVRKKVVPRARNAPSSTLLNSSVSPQLVITDPTTTTTTTSTTTTEIPEIILGNRTVSFIPSSFVPSEPLIPQQHSYNPHNSQPQQQQPVSLTNPHYYQNQYYQYEVPQHQFPTPNQHTQQGYIQRSHQAQQPQNPSLVEFARPRRNPNAQPDNHHGGNYQSHYQNQPMGPPPLPRSRQAQPQQQQQQNANKKEGPSAGNLMNIANMLMQTAMAGNNNNNGDQVSNIMQNAIPLVSSVATNPAIQNMVSSLVTSFLTPPQKPSPPPPTSKPPTTTPASQNLDDSYELSDDSQEDARPVKPVKQEPESNEIDNNSITSSSSSNTNAKPTSPPPETSGGGDGGGMLPNLLSQMVSTYVKYLLGAGGGGPPPTTKPSGINNRQPLAGSSKPSSSEPKDIVEMICNVAKPFFMSYFGVVPDDPGFGKLRINRNGHRHRSDKDGHSFSANDILTNDPDPGIDVFFGSANIPETGNGVIDFGNRVVYAFHSANDAQHGLYCFKQYSVNKVWDYFKLGVRAVFKK